MKTTTTTTSATNGTTSNGRTTKEEKAAAAKKTPSLDGRALFYMALLALQFGAQPILTRRYTSQGITRSTVILTQECLKFCMAFFMLSSSGNRQEALKDWTIQSWISVALLPAFLYAIQNLAALLAYQNLDALTFNVLNQTKTLSAALCCFLIMKRRQSMIQVLALLLLLTSVLVMEGIIPVNSLFGSSSGDAVVEEERPQRRGWRGRGSRQLQEDPPEGPAGSWSARHVTHGVAPILLASFLSGLAGALSQQNLQNRARNPYLFSMELCAGSALVLVLNLTWSPDGRVIWEQGFWHDWTLATLIPILTNSAGGIVVGLVTKYAGSVRKGFALCFGILLSGMIQAAVQPDQTIEPHHIVGGFLVTLSLYLHATNPPAPAPSAPAAAKPIKQD